MVGDYWNAPIRELIHEEETAVLNAALPQGIEHRYITLFRVRNGRVINNPRETVDEAEDQAMTAAEERKLSFPKLTDIPARKVSYDPCLHEGSPFDEKDDTVQAALDRICAVWPELKSGGGCTKTVGPGGDYETLEQAFVELEGNPDICLCLLPGDHVVNGGTVAGNSNGLRHLSISGCGAATRVYFRDNWRLINIEHLVLKQFHLHFVPGANLRVENSREVKIHDCHFHGNRYLTPLLICANCENLSLINTNIEIDSTELLFKHRNIMRRAFETKYDPSTDPFLSTFDKADNYSEFTEAVADLLDKISTMSGAELNDRAKLLRQAVEQARVEFELNDLEWLVYQEPLILLEEFRGKLTARHFQLIRMATQYSERGPALEIGPAGNNVSIEGCDIAGVVTLHAHFGNPEFNPGLAKEQVYSDFFKGHLTLRRNHIARVSLESPLLLSWAEILFTILSSQEPQINLPDNVPEDLHLKGGPFYRLVEITDNFFALPFNKIFGEACRLNSNLFSFNFPLTFNYDGNVKDPSGKDIKRIPVLFDVYSRHSTYVGNVHNARMEMDDLYVGDSENFQLYVDLIGYDYFNKIPPENTDGGTDNHIKRTILDFQNDLLILPRDLSDDTP